MNWTPRAGIENEFSVMDAQGTVNAKKVIREIAAQLKNWKRNDNAYRLYTGAGLYVDDLDDQGFLEIATPPFVTTTGFTSRIIDTLMVNRALIAYTLHSSYPTLTLQGNSMHFSKSLESSIIGMTYEGTSKEEMKYKELVAHALAKSIGPVSYLMTSHGESERVEWANKLMIRVMKGSRLEFCTDYVGSREKIVAGTLLTLSAMKNIEGIIESRITSPEDLFHLDIDDILSRLPVITDKGGATKYNEYGSILIDRNSYGSELAWDSNIPLRTQQGKVNMTPSEVLVCYLDYLSEELEQYATPSERELIQKSWENDDPRCTIATIEADCEKSIDEIIEGFHPHEDIKGYVTAVDKRTVGGEVSIEVSDMYWSNIIYQATYKGEKTKISILRDQLPMFDESMETYRDDPREFYRAVVAFFNINNREKKGQGIMELLADGPQVIDNSYPLQVLTKYGWVSGDKPHSLTQKGRKVLHDFLGNPY